MTAASTRSKKRRRRAKPAAKPQPTQPSATVLDTQEPKVTSRDFCYWLQGYFELAAASPDGARVNMSAAQVDTIRAHLNMVFEHEIDPSMGSSKHRKNLQDLHDRVTSLERRPAQRIVRTGFDPNTKLMC
jgi:uncharacterized protein YfkK (UPF0435 family)